MTTTYSPPGTSLPAWRRVVSRGRTVAILALLPLALQGCGFLRSLTGSAEQQDEPTAVVDSPAAAGGASSNAADNAANNTASNSAFACKTCRILADASKNTGDTAAATDKPAASAPTVAVAPTEPAVAVTAPVSVAAPVDAKPAPMPAAAPLPAAPPLPVTKESVPPATATLGHGYYINVGLFAIASNAKRAQGTLQEAHLPVLLDTVVSRDKGTLSRVRVGPFDTSAKAKAAAKTIRGLHLEAKIFKR